jgi:hypothetical protein
MIWRLLGIADISEPVGEHRDEPTGERGRSAGWQEGDDESEWDRVGDDKREG